MLAFVFISIAGPVEFVVVALLDVRLLALVEVSD